MSARVRWLLPRPHPKPFISKRASDRRTISLRNTDAAPNHIPTRAYMFLHLVDDLRGLLAREQKARALREEVIGVRIAAEVTDRQREVAPFDAHGWKRNEVVGWRESPFGRRCDHSMITGMIVAVRDERIEDHALEQFAGIGPGVATYASQPDGSLQREAGSGR